MTETIEQLTARLDAAREAIEHQRLDEAAILLTRAWQAVPQGVTVRRIGGLSALTQQLTAHTPISPEIAAVFRHASVFYARDGHYRPAHRMGVHELAVWRNRAAGEASLHEETFAGYREALDALARIDRTVGRLHHVVNGLDELLELQGLHRELAVDAYSAWTLRELGAVMLEAGRADTAITRYLSRADASYTRLGQSSAMARDHAVCSVLSGLAHRHLDQTAKADRSFNRALALLLPLDTDAAAEVRALADTSTTVALPTLTALPLAEFGLPAWPPPATAIRPARRPRPVHTPGQPVHITETTSDSGTDQTADKKPGKSFDRVSTARSRELGEELRRVRKEAGLASPKVSDDLGWSLGKLSKLEKGTRGTSLWEIGTLVGHCGADKATRDRVLALAAEPDTGAFLRLHHIPPDLLTALNIHENTARAITAYQPLTVPALAQIEDYTRALTDDQDLVQARMDRQEVLYHHTKPGVVLYLHEAALRLVVGGPAVMRDQLLHLALMGGWSHVTVRLIPLTVPAHPVLVHPATLLDLPEPLRPVAYTETDTATVFHDDPDVVAGYRAKMRHLHTLALPADRSREVFSRYADEYDRQAG
ncbi:helix-turn-helix transcriptional regulator [Saccharothrix xinjiangensis]|uniref:Helix-turn-helix domain-containing protein n=1 Tax=Saccharothrix xinjiangensis TaxID=204798 RepID=A0ABV9Y9S4_9PSEU